MGHFPYHLFSWLKSCHPTPKSLTKPLILCPPAPSLSGSDLGTLPDHGGPPQTPPTTIHTPYIAPFPLSPFFVVKVLSSHAKIIDQTPHFVSTCPVPLREGPRYPTGPWGTPSDPPNLHTYALDSPISPITFFLWLKSSH